MRRLLLAAVTAAALAPLPANAAIRYDRPCGGIVDAQCAGWTCSLDCFPRQCLVWLDPQHNPHLAVCVSPVG
jgi:hypothetical protein